MSHKFNPEHMDKLDTKKRRRNLPPEETLKKFNLKSSDVVADIGCGIGYFTIAAANLVSRPVYGLDISEKMLDELAIRKTEEQLDNINLINIEQAKTSLERESIDFMLMSNLLHEVEKQTEFLNRYLSNLKFGGKLAIIEWKAVETEFGPPLEERISKAKLYSLLEKLDLDVKIVIDLNQNQYGILAKK